MFKKTKKFKLFITPNNATFVNMDNVDMVVMKGNLLTFHFNSKEFILTFTNEEDAKNCLDQMRMEFD